MSSAMGNGRNATHLPRASCAFFFSTPTPPIVAQKRPNADAPAAPDLIVAQWRPRKSTGRGRQRRRRHVFEVGPPAPRDAAIILRDKHIGIPPHAEPPPPRPLPPFDLYSGRAPRARVHQSSAHHCQRLGLGLGPRPRSPGDHMLVASSTKWGCWAVIATSFVGCGADLSLKSGLPPGEPPLHLPP